MLRAMDDRHAKNDDYGIRHGLAAVQPTRTRNWNRCSFHLEFVPCRSVLSVVRNPDELFRFLNWPLLFAMVSALMQLG